MVMKSDSYKLWLVKYLRFATSLALRQGRNNTGFLLEDMDCIANQMKQIWGRKHNHKHTHTHTQQMDGYWGMIKVSNGGGSPSKEEIIVMQSLCLCSSLFFGEVTMWTPHLNQCNLFSTIS